MPQIEYHTKVCLFLTTLLSTFACGKRESVFIHYDKPYHEIQQLASGSNKPFCVVLVDANEDISKNFVDSLKGNYKHLAERSVYNILDVNHTEGKRYVKWLLPVSVPLTCIFSPDGDLIDIIPGWAKETFLYTKQAITAQKITDYHRPNRFQKNKAAVIPLLDRVFGFRERIEDGNYSWENNNSADSLPYPYSKYLLFRAALTTRDTALYMKYARLFLAMESANALEIYKEEFIEVNKAVNPGFAVETAPNIMVDNAVITLENSTVKRTDTIDVMVHNTGNAPLRIEKIDMSCTCVELEGERGGIIIKGKNSYTARFYFTPESEGLVSRDIFIASNAFNTPHLHINISANVKTE